MKRENSGANFGVILSDGIRLLLKWHSSILNIDYMYLFLKKSLGLKIFEIFKLGLLVTLTKSRLIKDKTDSLPL